MSDTDTAEHKRFAIPIALKFSTASEAGLFTGWASTFNGPPDAYGDVIATGAFTDTINKHRANDTAPALLWSHDMGSPIGIISQLRESAYGLQIDGRLALDVARGADAHALMKLGALGLSIGYRATSSTPMRNGRTLKSVDLFEVSAVAIPANSAAKVISVKARPDLVDLNNPRVAERILRDGGYGHAQSKAIVSLAKRAFKQRDVAIAEQILARKLIAAAAALTAFSN
jgi:HK97 family phage prohead protease